MNEPQLMYRHRFSARLEEPLKLRTLPGVIHSTETEAHRFEVAVMLDGVPCIPENVVGYALRPDGVRVMRPGTVEDGAACWVLPQEAIAVPGMVQVTLNAGSGDTVTTVLLCTMTVCGGGTGPMTDADDVLPSLNRLLQSIGDCEDAAAEAADAAALANEAAADARALGSLLVPRFTAVGGSITCHPLPGSEVKLMAPEGTPLLTCGEIPWRITGFVGAGTYYQMTGSQTGRDVPLPAGDWIISFRVHTQSGISVEKPVDLFMHFGDQTSRRVSFTEPEGSVTVHVDAPGGLSAWLVSLNGGWTAMGKPGVDMMIASVPMPAGELPEADTRPVTGNALTAPGGVMHIWSTDGSAFTAEGLRDPAYILQALCEKEGLL